MQLRDDNALRGGIYRPPSVSEVYRCAGETQRERSAGRFRPVSTQIRGEIIRSRSNFERWSRELTHRGAADTLFRRREV